MSLFWVSIEKFGYSGLSFISIIVLSRILVPQDFGLIGAIAIFISISQMVVESGLGASLVKKENPTNIDFSTIFIFNLSISIVLYIILFLVSPLIASYYDKPILSDLIRVLSLSIIFNAFTLTQRVHLIRDLNFKKQSLISISSLLMSIIISISLAFIGMGVWALVFQQLSYSFIYAVLVFFTVKYYPCFSFSMPSFKKLYSFGSKIFGASLIRITYNDIFSMIIAKKFNIGITGLYYQSKKLVDFPVNFLRALTDGATFPILAKIQNSEEFKDMCRKLNRGIFVIAAPLLLSLSFFCEPYILIVLGDKWVEAIPFLKILSLSAIPLALESISHNIIKATGHAGYILKTEIIKKTIGFLLLFLAIQYSIEHILWSIVICNMLACLINILIVGKITFYTYKSQFKDIFIPIILSLIAFSVVYLFDKYIVSVEILLINLMIKITLLLLIYFLLGISFNVKEFRILKEKVSLSRLK